ncbi:putative protein phosphatase 2C 55 [Primulina tabacum]|uniref:putative protein phosphatase 2C 55 n=1 Tax=Primulina tabacum TaxID=48773 RepID=UPI003F59DAB6
MSTTSEGAASVDVQMIAGSYYIPKNDPDNPLGDDSHFIDEVVQVIGVADGIDGGKYARELMGKVAEKVKIRRYPVASLNPKYDLKDAFSNSWSTGACTVCIIALDENLLKAVNVGDSGFMVIRGGNVVYTSPVQHKAFDCPYLMGKTTGVGPGLAEELQVQVEAGDVIIAGTDGLFDNLFPEEIEAIVKVSLEQNDIQPNLLAESLAKAALEKSSDRSCKSPYGVAAQAAGLEYSGGKSDDITVVAGYVRAYSKAKVHKFCSCCNWWSPNSEFRNKKTYYPRKRNDYTSVINRYKENAGTPVYYIPK